MLPEKFKRAERNPEAQGISENHIGHESFENTLPFDQKGTLRLRNF